MSINLIPDDAAPITLELIVLEALTKDRISAMSPGPSVARGYTFTMMPFRYRTAAITVQSTR